MPESLMARGTLPEEAQVILRAFAADVYALLQQDSTAAGLLIRNHIGRQLDLVGSERYALWFAQVGQPLGFDQATALAAVAGSDVTKVGPFSEVARSNFGTTQDRVSALAAAGDLRFGRAFTNWTPLENLYAHSEGGRHYVRDELLRRAEPLGAETAHKVASDASEGVVGHDSFNAGFGQRKLKPLLASRHNEPADAFDYPKSTTPVGFIVQTLDRIESCDPETMLRFVSEGVVQRNEPISLAIKTGVIDNAFYLREVWALIRQDARQALAPAAYEAFLQSPAMLDFVDGLERLPGILALFGQFGLPAGDGCFRLKRGKDLMRVDSLETFKEHFLPAIKEAEAVT
jgi:hypothetical protein